MLKDLDRVRLKDVSGLDEFEKWGRSGMGVVVEVPLSFDGYYVFAHVQWSGGRCWEYIDELVKVADNVY